MKFYILFKIFSAILFFINLFLLITFIVGIVNGLSTAEQLSAWWQSLIK